MAKKRIKRKIRKIIFDRNQNYRIFSFMYVLLITLLTASFLVFMVLLRPLLSHPDIPRNLGNTMFVLIIILVLLTGITGMLIFGLLDKKRLT
jgi:hypothetical protein